MIGKLLFFICVVSWIIFLCFTGCIENNSLYYKKPTLQEVYNFVEEDKTDEKPYVYSYYVCADYSEEVINHVKQYNYRVGFVSLDNVHAIVCFDTTEGIYFLEPQLDVVFPKTKMDEMKSNHRYDLYVDYGYMIEYFGFYFYDYTISWR